MATRIRTVKPDLFRHEGLFELEQETGLPVRLVFIGLFCCADREGRFKWRPRELTLDIMPYENFTRLSRVLDALGTRGFLVKYASEGDWYGMIPTFLKHQQINNREQASFLPAISDADEVFDFKTIVMHAEPNENNDLSARQPRVNHASTTRLEQDQGEGKGREGKGIDQDQDQKLLVKFDQKSAFDIFWKLYPRKVKKTPSEAKFMNKCKDAETFEKIIRGVGEHIQHAWNISEMQFIPHAATWLNQERWNDEVSHVRPNTTGTNAGTNRQSRPSLVEQVRQRGRELEAERGGQAGYGPAPDAELSDPAAYAGIDWDGEFSRIDVTDGSLMGPDD